jgi:hypothetical protein
MQPKGVYERNPVCSMLNTVVSLSNLLILLILSLVPMTAQSKA